MVTVFIKAHVWQTVIPKSLSVYRLSRNIGIERVRWESSHDTDNQPYECTPVGVPDVNNSMARHVELARLGSVPSGPVLQGVARSSAAYVNEQRKGEGKKGREERRTSS